MTGRRRPDGGHPLLYEGDYWKDGNGMWHVRPPKSHLGTLANHEVTEHEDGTISVSPSINTVMWHGHLIRGEWSDS